MYLLIHFSSEIKDPWASIPTSFTNKEDLENRFLPRPFLSDDYLVLFETTDDTDFIYAWAEAKDFKWKWTFLTDTPKDLVQYLTKISKDLDNYSDNVLNLIPYDLTPGSKDYKKWMNAPWIRPKKVSTVKPLTTDDHLDLD